jgi:hypothetical protein
MSVGCRRVHQLYDDEDGVEFVTSLVPGRENLPFMYMLEVPVRRISLMPLSILMLMETGTNTVSRSLRIQGKWLNNGTQR